MTLTILNKTSFRLEGIESTGVIFWYYFQLFLSFLFFPITARLFPKSLDLGYGVNRLLSLLFVVFINWTLTFLGIMSNTQPGLFLCLMGVLFLTHTRANGGNDLIHIMKLKYKEIMTVEALYFICFTVFLLVFSFHPDLYWGEKPMDFNLLNFGFRETQLPWQDPWFLGEKLKYYYFGYYFFASLIKFAGVGPEVGYSLSVATTSALFCTSLFGLFYLLLKRLKLSLVGAICLTFASNLQSFSLLFEKSNNINAKYFWNITRLFKDHYFAEFPSWSFLFADLHPHVMSYMLGILFLFFIFYYLKNLKSIDSFFLFFMAIAWGSLIATNSWDFIIYTLVFGVILLSKLYFKRDTEAIKYYLKKPMLVGLLSFFLYLPFLYSITGGRGVSLSINKKIFHSLSEIYMHHGHWWLIVLLMWVPVLVSKRKTLVKNVLLHSDGFSLFLATMVVFIFAYFFQLFDYMNTTFKFFNQLYVLWGILAILSLRNFNFYLYRKKYLIICILTIITFNTVLIGGVTQAMAVTEYRPLRSLKKTLYGTDYLSVVKPEHFGIIKWINSHIRGTPGIVELYSKSFDSSGSLISTHTGLPSYLGWDNHVKTRGIKSIQIEERKRNIDFIYNSNDPIKVNEFLISKNINFLIITSNEKSRYRARSIRKFKKYADLFVPLHQQNGSIVYGIGDFKKYLR